MGVLVGTSLIVIIPEGVDTLYSASSASSASVETYDTHSHSHSRRDYIPPPLSLDVRWQQQQEESAYAPLSARKEEFDPTAPSPFGEMPGPVFPNEDASINPDSTTSSSNDPPKTPTEPGKIGILNAPPFPSTSHSPSPPANTPTKHPSRTPHAWIGISLILGFILMYLLDHLAPLLSPHHPSSSSSSSTTNRTQNNIYSLSDLSTTSPSHTTSPQNQNSFSTTLGLIIHAAADGIALGASHISTHTSLGFIIFLAIMIHKAPAAFGLTSVLLKQGVGKRGARARLVVFSLAAPVGAVGTWVLVRVLGRGGGGGGGVVGEEMSTRWWTGVLLLFSGGTFLYVAMHTMQENDISGVEVEETMGGFGNGYLDSSGGGGMHRRDSWQGGKQQPVRSLKLLAAAVGGMLLPLITQIGHAH
ncbi:MAG: hypothetical protein LQ350_000875 [Teloschistes chrysophthalmus]|nr:MAG: hypothetical protein LQ350_000875 [Niorma chrysophthalma]